MFLYILTYLITYIHVNLQIRYHMYVRDTEISLNNNKRLKRQTLLNAISRGGLKESYT